MAVRPIAPGGGYRNSQGGTVRRDRLGRRIGANWWREYICATLQDAEDAWQALRESGLATDNQSGYYQLSDAEFKTHYPRPTLKDFLIRERGMNTERR